MLDAGEVKALGPEPSGVVVPYLTGRELLDEFRIERWAIDFGDRDILAAAQFARALDHCKRKVLPAVRKSYEDALQTRSDMAGARKEHLDRWWQFWNRRDELSSALKEIRRYIACSRVTRRPVMVFLSADICPSDLVQVFALDDDYSYGILQSYHHFEWFRKSSRLKVESDTRYSVREVFDTFPWPQSPSAAQVRAVAAAGREIRRIRDEALVKIKGGLRALYRTLELPGANPLKDAHAALDAAVMEAYGFSPSPRSTSLTAGRPSPLKGEGEVDVLATLLELNLEVAGRIAAGLPVTGPGVPADFPDPQSLVTEDCIRPG